MRLAIVGVVFFSALGVLLWISLVEGSIPVYKVHELVSGQVPREECRIEGGKIHSIEKRVNPLRFTVTSEKVPGVLLKVESPSHPPDNFDEGKTVSLLGTYNSEKGVFVATDIATSCPSKYEPKSGEGSYGPGSLKELPGAKKLPDKVTP